MHKLLIALMLLLLATSLPSGTNSQSNNQYDYTFEDGDKFIRITMQPAIQEPQKKNQAENQVVNQRVPQLRKNNFVNNATKNNATQVIPQNLSREEWDQMIRQINQNRDLNVLSKYPININEVDPRNFAINIAPVPKDFRSNMPMAGANKDLDPQIIFEGKNNKKGRK